MFSKIWAATENPCLLTRAFFQDVEHSIRDNAVFHLIESPETGIFKNLGSDSKPIFMTRTFFRDAEHDRIRDDVVFSHFLRPRNRWFRESGKPQKVSDPDPTIFSGGRSRQCQGRYSFSSF